MTQVSISVSEHARSADLKPDRSRVVVTLPTFRRPDHLVTTLDSLQTQGVGEETAVVIMDNDVEGLQGAHAAVDWLASSRLKGIVIVAHQRGNCHAYNAGWQTALTEFPRLTHIAVIDDDEIAGPEWLSGLMKTALKTGADLVGGPQFPVFADKSLNSWRKHPVFTPHYSETGLVPILYSSGNVLITRPVLDIMPRPFLDPAFNFIGGGDSDFLPQGQGTRVWVCLERRGCGHGNAALPTGRVFLAQCAITQEWCDLGHSGKTAVARSSRADTHIGQVVRPAFGRTLARGAARSPNRLRSNWSLSYSGGAWAVDGRIRPDQRTVSKSGKHLISASGKSQLSRAAFKEMQRCETGRHQFKALQRYMSERTRSAADSM